MQGFRLCISIAHIHIKPLYELNTCPAVSSPNSLSLALCLKLPASMTKMVIELLLSLSTCSHCSPCRPKIDRWHRYDVSVISPGNQRDEVITAITQTAKIVTNKMIIFILWQWIIYLGWHYNLACVTSDSILGCPHSGTVGSADLLSFHFISLIETLF